MQRGNSISAFVMHWNNLALRSWWWLGCPRT